MKKCWMLMSYSGFTFMEILQWIIIKKKYLYDLNIHKIVLFFFFAFRKLYCISNTFHICTNTRRIEYVTRLRCLGGGMFWGILRIIGLGWSVSVEWCREYESCSVSVTNGNCMSLRIVVFLTYHGASNAILSILFWSTCILCICVCDAEFHIEHAYCQIGLIYEV
jgi:hypothetical protein